MEVRVFSLVFSIWLIVEKIKFRLSLSWSFWTLFKQQCMGYLKSCRIFWLIIFEVLFASPNSDIKNKCDTHNWTRKPPLISWVGCKPSRGLIQVFSLKVNFSNKVLAKSNFLLPCYHGQKLGKHLAHHSNQKFCLLLAFAHNNVISLLSFGCYRYSQLVPGKSHKILSQVTWQSSGRENCFSAVLYCFELQMSLYLLQVFVSFCFVFNPAVALSVLESKIYISLTV